MTNARRRALIGFLALLAVGIALVFAERRREAIDSALSEQRPKLLLLTSLPLMFGEDFSLKGEGSDVMGKLQLRYRVLPISVTSAQELSRGSLLLMAQPWAQTAENLVALDAWVRRGGRVLLLADPMLEWPSQRPLGDRLSPPPMFADTGLLAHWGLRLDAPDQRGPMLRTMAGREIETVSPGALSGHCAISSDRLIANCAIERGRAVVVADADLLNVAEIDGPTDNNLPALLTELERLAALN